MEFVQHVAHSGTVWLWPQRLSPAGRAGPGAGLCPSLGERDPWSGQSGRRGSRAVLQRWDLPVPYTLQLPADLRAT